MKENNGKGARRRLGRQVAILLVVGAALLGLSSLFRTKKISPQDYAARMKALKDNEFGPSENRNLFDVHRPSHSRPDHHQQHHRPDLDDMLKFVVLKEDTPLGVPEWQDILHGRVNLVDLQFIQSQHHPDEEYSGVFGIFCQVDWKLHKEDPSSSPMFRDLVAKSDDCSKRKIKVAWELLVSRIKDFDDRVGTTNVLELSGIVFHESRCGSTLVANMLASMDEKHRVYSESSPPVAAMLMVCGPDNPDCSDEMAAQLLQDVIYLMSRSDQEQETRVFFKIQSAGALKLPQFLHAIGETPWIFVYRNPVQIMVSHLKVANIRQANCVRQQYRSPPQIVQSILERRGLLSSGGRVQQVDPIDYCAAHLAAITETAVKALQEHPHFGRAVNYQDLPSALWEDLLPNHFHIPVDAQQQARMEETSNQYSKGRSVQKQGEFHEDSERKEEQASAGIKQAAARILEESYAQLQAKRGEWKDP